MKESNTREYFMASIVDSNGELHPIEAIKDTSNRYFTIKRINLKVCYMDFIKIQSKLCRSSKDILIFGDLFNKVDRENELRINVTQFCQKYGYTRSRINKMLKEAIEVGFVKKLDRGLYLINPFVLKGKGCSNETLERLQLEWSLEE